MGTSFKQPTVLGRSGLTVGRLGLASSYGAPARAYEQAFERGCNYFYAGSILRAGMIEAIRNLAAQHRERMVIVVQSYSRFGTKVGSAVESKLRLLKLNYADILLLGWHNAPLRAGLMEAALREKERGRVRHLEVSGHHRAMFQQFAKDMRLDALMVRYNAAHRGAETEVFPYLQSGDLPKPGVVTYTATRWKTLIDPRRMPPNTPTPSAVDCYRFVLSNPSVDVCLTGPATMEEMQANLRTLELGPMSQEELAWMRRVGDRVHHQTPGGLGGIFGQRAQ